MSLDSPALVAAVACRSSRLFVVTVNLAPLLDSLWCSAVSHYSRSHKSHRLFWECLVCVCDYVHVCVHLNICFVQNQLMIYIIQKNTNKFQHLTAVVHWLDIQYQHVQLLVL